jgi:hypothetical protein
VDEFHRTGLVRLPGAVSPAAMADRVWAHLAAGHGAVRDRPETWPAGSVTGLRPVTDAPEFAALGSPAIHAAADAVLGAGRWHPPRRWGRLLVTFPSGNAEWDLPSGSAWHNDFVPPRPGAGVRAVQIFWLLADLPPRGGGTLVLTGSHHLVERSGEAPHPRRLRQALGRQPWLRDLWEPAAGERVRRFMHEGTTIDGVDLKVVELTGRAGDAFVMHCDTLHAMAPNCGSQPRLMATTILMRAADEEGPSRRSVSG